MSAKPKYWDLVHKDDQLMGRAPRNEITFLAEGMLFGLAVMFALAFLFGQLLHGNNWQYVLLDVAVTPTVLVILGLFARRRRIKINNRIRNFYSRRPIN